MFQLLYRCVEAVNLTHDRVHAQMDVKLRSLICMGLNEQVLHLWLESICSNAAVVQKWYQPWSFMSSPGWVQVRTKIGAGQKCQSESGLSAAGPAGAADGGTVGTV